MVIPNHNEVLAQKTEAAREALTHAHVTCTPVDCQLLSVRWWVLGLHALLEADEIEVAKASLPSLVTAFPKHPHFQTLSDILAQLPPAPPTSFVDDPTKAVQFVQSTDAKTIIFAFTGLKRKLMIEMSLAHRWFSRLGVHVAYLRDFQEKLFVNGIQPLAHDYRGTIDALRRMADNVGASRLCCLGTSLGGHGALRYAADLGAERALVYSPLTFITPDIAAGLANGETGSGRSVSPEQLKAFDLRPILQAATHHPLSKIVFGRDNIRDKMQARHLEGIPNIHLVGLPGVETHNSLVPSIHARRFDQQLRWLIGATAEGSRQASAAGAAAALAVGDRPVQSR